MRKLPTTARTHPILGACLALAIGVQAQGSSDPSDSQPTPAPLPLGIAAAVRVESGPVIDGKLDDEVWQKAPVGGPLTQYEPRPGEPMSQRTEFRILYDDRRLYVGVWCFDTEPDKIVGRVMEREGAIWGDDYFLFVLDTFHDQRNGYVFFVNANGARRDGLISDNINENHDWDGIWTARTSRDAEGWKVEVAIPFKTLSFDPNVEVWGFNIDRAIGRAGERGRWVAPSPRFRTGNVSEAGDLTGLRQLKQGLGLEVSPYAVGRFKRGRGISGTSLSGDFGGDIRYRITPNLSATATYNTDFAETEVDRRQLNFTRFPLFFPEKRAFFLEDIGIFNFGGLGNELIPFFSRRVGLDNAGNVVPILAAGKLAGRAGPYNLGFMDAVLDEQPGLARQNVFVGRVSRNVFNQSTVGMMATLGDPNRGAGNELIGPDYRYRTTTFLGDKTLEASAFALGSHTGNAASELGHAYGVRAAYPNDTVEIDLKFYEIDGGFNPALGFVPRKSIRNYESLWTWAPRPAESKSIRQWAFTYSNRHVTGLDNRLESARHEIVPLAVSFVSTDSITLTAGYESDSPPAPFTLGGVAVPAGDYSWTDASLRFYLADKRPVGGSVGALVGGFYGGRRQRLDCDLNFRPDKRVRVNLSWAYDVASLPGGNFDAHQIALATILNFTPDLRWSHLVQYDTLTDSIGYNSRVQWEYRPGQKVFVALNQAYLETANAFAVQSTEFAIKSGFTFRF